MATRRKLQFSAFILTIILLLGTIWANTAIKKASKPYVSADLKALSNFKVGLLLGTCKNLPNGDPNEFFFNRIDAAAELYKNKKIQYILISGDNSTAGYSEPVDMKNELLKQGVPDSAIYLDYAGFRTLDSVVRAKEVFGQRRFLVISQQFHNERAVYIARAMGIEAFGYNAKDVTASKGFKTRLREYFARVKVFLDLRFGVQPRFLGERILIGSAVFVLPGKDSQG